MLGQVLVMSVSELLADADSVGSCYKKESAKAAFFVHDPTSNLLGAGCVRIEDLASYLFEVSRKVATRCTDPVRIDSP